MAGNITKVKDGHYRLRYRDYSQYVEAKSDRAAQQAMAKFITAVDSGNFAKPSKVTFREFAERWLKDYADVELAPKTVFRYKQMLISRIYPAFGEKKLEKIKPIDLLDFYGGLRKKHKYFKIAKDGDPQEAESPGLSERTIKHHHGLISAIFEKAIKWDVFKGTNPAERVDAPKTEKKKAGCYNLEQTEKLLDALSKLDGSDLKYRTATTIALLTGARLGEIMGLEWGDIDFDKKVIEITRVSQYLPGKGIFTKPPKPESSERRISVNDMLLDLLKKYRNDQREKGFICQDNNRLFVTWEGKPMFPNTLTKWFPQFLKRNKLPHMNFHGLRHTSATFLISQRVDIQTVAGRLGHSTSATTQNIYSHFLESQDRQAADIMEDVWARKAVNQLDRKDRFLDRNLSKTERKQPIT